MFIFSIIQFLIQYWIQSHFSRKSSEKLEMYKVVMGGNLNRKIKFIEREYIAISECWGAFMKAYGSIKESVYGIYQPYDFSIIEKDKLDVFLKEFGFLDYQIEIMKRSSARNEKFLEICKVNSHNKAKSFCSLFQESLNINEIFMSDEVLRDFNYFLGLFRGVFEGLNSLKIARNIDHITELHRKIDLLNSDEAENRQKELLLKIRRYLGKSDS